MRYILTLVTILLLSCFRLHGQGVSDAVINSQDIYEGTSRSIAMGGATGAMGGDVTAICINPAGLGLYRTSELTFTTGLQHNLTSSTYYDGHNNGSKFKASVPNFGYVLTMECSNYQPIRFLQLSIGLTRTNDFNYRAHAHGLNPSSSLVDSYLQTINGIDELFDGHTDPESYLYDHYAYDLHPAWQTFLIDRFQDSLGAYYYNSPIPQGNVYQDNDIVSSGRTEEWTMALGTNIVDKVYFGTSIGFDHVKRRYSRIYTETPGAEGQGFSEWSYAEELGNDAWGVNWKIGLIYTPAPWLRLGAAYHTRTIFDFDETWYTTTSTSLTDGHTTESYWYQSPTLTNNYDFYSPRCLVGSAAFLFGRQGMITTDFEYMNYGVSEFASDDLHAFDDANAAIDEVLKSTFNIRVGAEWRVRQYYLRGGVAYYGSPYGFGGRNGSAKRLGVGIGYVTNNDVYWDFAYELGQSTTLAAPYYYYVDGENAVEDVVRQQWRSKILATMKFKL